VVFRFELHRAAQRFLRLVAAAEIGESEAEHHERAAGAGAELGRPMQQGDGLIELSKLQGRGAAEMMGFEVLRLGRADLRVTGRRLRQLAGLMELERLLEETLKRGWRHAVFDSAIGRSHPDDIGALPWNLEVFSPAETRADTPVRSKLPPREADLFETLAA
jgi:hypothetical protein